MDDEEKFGSINYFIDIEQIKKFQRLSQEVRKPIKRDIKLPPKLQMKQNKVDYCKRILEQSDIQIEKGYETTKVQTTQKHQTNNQFFSVSERKKKQIQSKSLSKSFDQEKKQNKKEQGLLSFQMDKEIIDPTYLKRKHYLLKSIHQIEIEHQKEKLPNRYDGTFQRIYLSIRDYKKEQQNVPVILRPQIDYKKENEKKIEVTNTQFLENLQKQKNETSGIENTDFDDVKGISISETQRKKKLDNLDLKAKNREKLLRDSVARIWIQKRKLSVDSQSQNHKSAKTSQETIQEIYQEISSHLQSPVILRKICSVRQREKSTPNYLSLRNHIQPNVSNNKKLEPLKATERTKGSQPPIIYSNDHDVFHQLQDIIQDIENGLQK